MRFHYISRSLLLGLLVVSFAGCGSDGRGAQVDQRTQVEIALNDFAAELAADFPSQGALPDQIRAYLEAHPIFFGSTVASIGEDGAVFDSPYVYRLGDVLAEKNLATPDYDIDNQDWLAEPRDSMESVWTDPYFDAGGGDIWMVTLSVPLTKDGRVYAVATTDLPVDPPTE